MFRNSFTAAWAALAVFGAAMTTAAQPKAEAEAKALSGSEVLQSVADAMKDAEAVQYEVTQLPGSGPNGEVRTARMTFNRPNLARIEMEDDNGRVILIVFDGKNRWYYFKDAHKYRKSEQKDDDLKALGTFGVLFLVKDAPGVVLKDTMNVAVRQDKLGDDAYTVVRWETAKATHELWIDEKKTIRRDDELIDISGMVGKRTLEYRKIDLSPKLADDLFSFTPPDDATAVEPSK